MRPFEIALSGEDISLQLIGALTVEHARDLHTCLRVLLNAERGLAIDAAQLTRIDAAALQVLIAAAHTATGITVVARSDAWDDAFRRYALDHSHLQPARRPR